MIVIKPIEELVELREMFINMQTIDVLGEDFVIETIEVIEDEVVVKLVQIKKIKISVPDRTEEEKGNRVLTVNV